MGTRVAAAPHFSDKTFAGVLQLIEDLQKLADDHESADIVFLIGRDEVPVYAHRIILMARFVFVRTFKIMCTYVVRWKTLKSIYLKPKNMNFFDKNNHVLTKRTATNAVRLRMAYKQCITY